VDEGWIHCLQAAVQPVFVLVFSQRIDLFQQCSFSVILEFILVIRVPLKFARGFVLSDSSSRFDFLRSSDKQLKVCQFLELRVFNTGSELTDRPEAAFMEWISLKSVV
jgi:hypothetical protein